MTRNQNNEAWRHHYYAPGLGDGSIHVQNQKQPQGLRGQKRTRAGNAAYDDKITSPFRQSLDRADGFSSEVMRVSSHGNGHALKPEITSTVDDLEFHDSRGGGQATTSDRRTSMEYLPEDTISNHGLRIPNTMSSDGPWQLSVVVLLGIIGILIALFIHFITADTTNEQQKQYTYLRSRIKKRISYKSPNYRKKTDEWSDDAAEDDDYTGDTEEMSAVASSLLSGNIAKKRMNIPPSPQPPNDPTARLYYNVGDGYSRHQGGESRLRKSTPGVMVPAFQTPSRRSRPSSSVASSNDIGNRGTYQGTVFDHETPGDVQKNSEISHKGDTATFRYPPTPPLHDGGVGSGLEGFNIKNDSIDSGSWAGSFDTETIVHEPVVTSHTKVKPMGTFTPTDSFAVMPSCDSDEDKNDSLGTITFETPPMTTKIEAAKNTTMDTIPPSSINYSPSFATHEDDILSPRRSSRVLSTDMDFPTPRVENFTTKREVDKKIIEATNQMAGFALPFSDTEESNEHHQSQYEDDQLNLLRDYSDVPMVPNLNRSPHSGDTQRSIDAPRSVLLEELHLIRMESGVQGPRWISEAEPKHQDSVPIISSAPSTDSPSKHGGQNYMHPMFGNEDTAWYEPPDSGALEQRRQFSENEAKLREASSVIDPADDPRNSIQHVRNDLTEASDTSSSLSSNILFSELKLLEVIGGGGFGQVWSAKWKGTPVAVKVLTGAAQAESVPKAVIEEFIAEINMVSGMRHPNICLFMGACLIPPNRAIVTELCENGSLWDALRTPLSPPYQKADGITRAAWPLQLYDTLNQPPTSPTRSGHALHDNADPPIVPAGAWPWILVKRVASGTARGMCYLHSGNPPVLHRDLKSANILLDESYTAKLADFGLSRLKAVRSGMTGNCGTVQWMAPEVLCNEDYAEPADGKMLSCCRLCLKFLPLLTFKFLNS